MDIKPRANHQLYLKSLAAMTVDDKFRKIAEMNEATRTLFRDGLRAAFPEKSEEESIGYTGSAWHCVTTGITEIPAQPIAKNRHQSPNWNSSLNHFTNPRVSGPSWENDLLANIAS